MTHPETTMNTRQGRRLLALAALGLAMSLATGNAGPPAAAGADVDSKSLIVQAPDTAAAAAAVRAAGGSVTSELNIIRAVVAELTPAQRARLETGATPVRVFGNRGVELAGGRGGGGNGGGGGGGSNWTMVETYYPTHLGADLLHQEGIDGSGVTVAMLDSGIYNDTDGALYYNPSGDFRALVVYDVESNTAVQPWPGNFGKTDKNGHGSHITSAGFSSRPAPGGGFAGIAPAADLAIVKAFDDHGQATYADVILGIEWVVANKDAYGIRVLNCSFGAEPVSYYWDDPLNLAIMAAWKAGIVVVASAGNRGPDAMTINVPGNVPYVITVGAMTDNLTPADMTDDFLASFSSAGPTVEGFVKPDVVAPGGHVLGLMKGNSRLATDHPEFHDGNKYFNMSGTSQAAAHVSGIVALMLQQSPQLTPDEVKHRLITSARPSIWTAGGGGGDTMAYTVFQQGAGMVHAYDAVRSTAEGVANRGLDINLDLLGLQHYGGPANAYATGNPNNPDYVYYVRDANGDPLDGDGYLWGDDYEAAAGFVWEDGYMWGDGYIWTEGYLWVDGYLWGDGYVWGESYLWSDGYPWTELLTESMGVNVWVDQE